MDIILKNKNIYIFLVLIALVIFFIFGCSFDPMSKEDYMAIGQNNKKVKDLEKKLKEKEEEAELNNILYMLANNSNTTNQTNPVESSAIKVTRDGTAIPVNGSFNFDTITVTNRTNPIIFTIQNIGNKELVFTGNPVVAIDNNADFVVDCTNITASGNKIAANGNNTITIQFKSSATDGSVRKANVTIKNNLGNDYKFTISCTAKSESSVMNVISEGTSISVGSSFNFDTISAINRQNPIIFTISNIGNKELIFTGNPVVSIDNMNDFAVDYTNITASGNRIAANNYKTITIRYISLVTDGSVRSTNVTIKNNLGSDYTFTINCTAKEQRTAGYIINGNYTWTSPGYGTISVFLLGSGGGGGGSGGSYTYSGAGSQSGHLGYSGGGGGAGWNNSNTTTAITKGAICYITVGKGGNGGIGGNAGDNAGNGATGGGKGVDGGASVFTYNGYSFNASGGIGGNGGSSGYPGGSNGSGGAGNPSGNGINGGESGIGNSGKGGDGCYSNGGQSTNGGQVAGSPGDNGTDGFASIVWVGFIN